MKKILLYAIFVLLCSIGKAQYNPSIFTTVNKSIGISQAVPTDARSQYWDATNFISRPYISTAEVLSYLNLPKYRTGNFLITINTGGTLNGNGTITGGTNAAYWFKDGVADGNLVLFTTGSNPGTVTNVTSTSAAGITLAITNPSSIPNITPSVVLGGDISGSSLSLVTVAKFNGLTPSYYLNYNNLTNLPSIPAQLNPTCVGCTITGTYPNYVWTISGGGGGGTAGYGILFTSGGSVVNIDSLNYRKVDSMYTTNDSTLIYLLNGVSHSLQIKGGHGAGGGGGSGTVTNFSFVNANGVSGSVTNPTSIPALTITLGAITPTTVNGITFAQVSGGFTITGGTGTPHTLTVTANANVAGTNTGDVTLAGETYITISGQVITANAVNLSGTNVTGTLAAARFGALTGDVTNSAGSYATTISANVVTFAKFQQVLANKLVGNPTGSTANVQAIGLGFGLIFNGTNLVLDTANLNDTVYVAELGSGITTGRGGINVLYLNTLESSSDIAPSKQPDSGIKFNLTPTSITAASYAFANVTFDANGRATGASSGATGITNYYDVIVNGSGQITSRPLIWHTQVSAASAAALNTNTYNNGTSGVGATITCNTNGQLTVDGLTFVGTGGRVLVKDEVNQTHNGIYIVTAPGSVSTPFILTRDVYASVSVNMAGGTGVYADGGTANGGKWFVQITSGAPTFGGTNLVYTALGSGGGGGAVSAVSNSDGTLTISPTTGSVTASINLSHVNTWSGAQTFSAAFSATSSTVSVPNIPFASSAAKYKVVIEDTTNGNLAHTSYFPIDTTGAAAGSLYAQFNIGGNKFVLATVPTLSSGTYTPTISNLTNVSTTTAQVCNYSRNGNIVMITGYLLASATVATTTACFVDITIPIASTFSSTIDATGVSNLVVNNAQGNTGGIAANTSTNKITIGWSSSPSTGSLPVYFSLSYIVH